MLGYVLGGEDPSPRRQSQLFDVLTANAKATACNAGNHLELALIRKLSFHAERPETLNAHVGYEDRRKLLHKLY